MQSSTLAEITNNPLVPLKGAILNDALARNEIAFVLRLGRALHQYGYPAHRVEAVMERAAQQFELQGQFFTTPTSIFAAFGALEEQRTYLMRVEPGESDLGKLAALDEVTSQVLRGKISPARGAQRIDEILAAPSLYSWPLTIAAFGLASAAASRFLGGGEREILVAGLLGLMIGVLALLTSKWQALGRVFELVAAFAVSSCATIIATQFGSRSIANDILAGLIVLMPGLTLTTAMNELSTRHLVSGTARLSAAFVIFLELGFGVAVGGIFIRKILGEPRILELVALPAWTLWLALLIAPLAFTVLLRAQPRDAMWIVIAGILAFIGSQFGAGLLGPELGVFIGALTVSIASNLYSRLMDRPSTITLVPGILLLVPGSVGFRSLASLMDKEVIPGIETAFKMILIAVALAAGILVGKIVAPPRGI
ncbi:threonine/serine exporter family protein [candidate division KSB1 bacterium]|nr:threonine/serine exporter family protein [candidate division KSB1 bacterium]